MSSVTAGSSSPSVSRSGAPIGGPARTAAAIAVCQSSGVHEHDGGGPVGVAGGREQRAGDAGGVGDRVGAAHPDRVARGGGGEAELLGGLVVVRIDAQLRRALLVVAERATADQSRANSERESQSDAWRRTISRD